MAFKMHADEIEIDESLVARLIAWQCPEWSSLPLNRVNSAGTDHAIFRLGDELAVRLPRILWATDQVDKEFSWLPRLAPHLPLAISEPLAKGQPAKGYPWNWGVYRWLDGENPASATILLATDLAEFVSALQQIDPTDVPRSNRGGPLADRDGAVRESLAALGGEIGTDAAFRAWESALEAPVWDKPPVWIHGDLQSGNLLAQNGRLNAVIDFGFLGLGDPAVELLPAWNLFSGESRQAYRNALAVDDATWERGRGWALSVALIALPYYRRTNPVLVEASHRTISEILSGGGI